MGCYKEMINMTDETPATVPDPAPPDPAPPEPAPAAAPPADDADEEKETISLIDKANEAAERLEDANKETAINLRKQESLQVEEKLGGTAEAGTPQIIEESPEDYAKKVMANDIDNEKK